LLDEAKVAYEEAGEEDGVLDTEARIAEALLSGGDAERALVRASTAVVRCRKSESGTYVMPVLLRVIGCAHLLTGRLETGGKALEAGLGLAEALGAEFEIALSLDAIATLEQVAGGDGGTTVRRDELFARLGILDSPRPVIGC
jgi:hypothetical protein